MYRRRKFSGRLAFSLSAADSGKNSPVFESFSVSNGIRQLASTSGLVPAANEIATLSARARAMTTTCAMIQRHNDDARIASPKHALLPPRNFPESRADERLLPTGPRRIQSNIAKTLRNPVEKSLALAVLVVTLPVCHTTLVASGEHRAKPANPGFQRR